MLENATRICEAKFGTLFLFEGKAFRAVGCSTAPRRLCRRSKRRPGRSRSAMDAARPRCARTKQPVTLPICGTNRPTSTDPLRSRRSSPARASMFVVPMLKDERAGRRHRHLPPGGPAVHRQADRAGAELRRAGRHRHREYAAAQRTAPAHRRFDESLEQQTATSEVLKVISSSPGELEPVFQAMLANATRICEAKFGILFRCDGDAFASRPRCSTCRRHLLSSSGSVVHSDRRPEPASTACGGRKTSI